MSPCVVCEKEAEGHFRWTNNPRLKPLPVCESCMESGRFKKWFDESVKMLDECPSKAVSTGDLAEDRKQVEAFLKHDSRIKDGICPNGCAALVREFPDSDNHARCPKCGFGLYQNTKVNFLL